ncbi:hypothetical protein [Pectobacterium polaris]|nr:hypothetical protein [Pectobacterium polaris]
MTDSTVTVNGKRIQSQGSDGEKQKKPQVEACGYIAIIAMLI